MQPNLPIREEPRTVDYDPDGDEGVPWSVNDWRALRETFDLTESELVAWHADLAGDTRHWKIIKRIFGVMAVYGEAVEPEDAEEWDWQRLAKTWSVPEAKLREELAAAVDYWKKQRTSRKISQVQQGGAVKPVDGEEPARFRPHQDLAEERISELLSDYRFDHIKSKSDRLFVANRLLELRPALEDKNRRESARQLIQMEMNLADSENSRALLKSRLDSLGAIRGELNKDQAKEITDITKSLIDNQKEHTALATKYFTAAAEFGEEEIEQGELRKVALGTLSHFIEAQRRYHANGDRELIDGMFTADEVVWLTTKTALRPAQYRPDLVLRINEAMKPENLWDPNYVPTPIQREASRRMLKLCQGLTDEEDAPIIPEIDEAPGSEDSDDTDAPAADDSPPPQELPAPITTFGPPVREEEFMVLG